MRSFWFLPVYSRFDTLGIALGASAISRGDFGSGLIVLLVFAVVSVVTRWWAAR